MGSAVVIVVAFDEMYVSCNRAQIMKVVGVADIACADDLLDLAGARAAS